MKARIFNSKSSLFNGKKAKAILWNLTSELIGVYLWFLKFSNVLLKLVQ